MKMRKSVYPQFRIISCLFPVLVRDRMRETADLHNEGNHLYYVPIPSTPTFVGV